MNIRRRLTTILVTAGVLAVLAGCTAAPALPPSSTVPPAASPTPTETNEPVEPAGPIEPSTAVISATEVNSVGYTRYDVLEADALEAVGTAPDAPRVDKNNQPTPVSVIESAGGAVPTSEYVLNLSYKACAEVMALMGQNLSASDAFGRVMATLPDTIGVSGAENPELLGGYSSALINSYQYICVPLMDERARQDLEQGVYRG